MCLCIVVMHLPDISSVVSSAYNFDLQYLIKLGKSSINKINSKVARISAVYMLIGKIFLSILC